MLIEGIQMSLVREYGDLRDLEAPNWQTHYIIDCQGTDEGMSIIAGQRECVASSSSIPSLLTVIFLAEAD